MNAMVISMYGPFDIRHRKALMGGTDSASFPLKFQCSSWKLVKKRST